MIKYIFFCIALLCLSCQDVERPEKPDNLIDKDKMVDILYDVSLINAARSYSVPKLKVAGIKPENFVYEKYNIDSTQLAQSLTYYTVDFNTYGQIWERVNKRLETKRSEVDSIKKVSDSIARAKAQLLKDEGKDVPQRRNPNLTPPERREVKDSIL
ncbi:DUF4296 domain-containing protein [Leeuwenhoekiella sp. A16]|uniref:DUF4296 domain-containing protein n=1 Tax=unclassified Leeuwenhoekiella TaxID=2615029 RepID=UPI003A7FEC86